MQDYIYKIKDCKLFDGIKSEELQAMFGCLNSCLKSYTKKETVVSDGKIIDAIGIVVGIHNEAASVIVLRLQIIDVVVKYHNGNL